MITYKLALALKDAGFKQGKVNLPDLIYRPTLEELIEACGDKLFSIVRLSYLTNDPKENRWVWCAHNLNKEGMGDTISEAVANLWLALNEKK